MSLINKSSHRLLQIIRNPYVLIAITVILFNLIAVYGPVMPLGDDPMAIDNLKRTGDVFRIRHFTPFFLFKENLVFHLVDVSLELARLVYILLLMVPISWGFFYIYRYIFNLPMSPSIATAVLPQILPSMWLIPASLNGSYTLWGTMFFVLTMIAGHSFLKTKKWRWLVAGLTAYYLALQMMEQTLFLVIPLLLFFLWFNGKSIARTWLVITLLVLASYRFMDVVLDPRKEPVIQSLGSIIYRGSKSIVWSLPFSELGAVFSLVLFGVLFAFTPIVMGKINKSRIQDQDITIRQENPLLSRVWWFAVAWAGCSLAPFILMNRYFTPRYFHVAAFGLNLVLIVGIWVWFQYFSPGNYSVMPALMILLICFSGLMRYQNLDKRFEAMSIPYRIIQTATAGIMYPRDSQIIIEFSKNRYNRRRSVVITTAYLRYMLKRTDVVAIITGTCRWKELFPPAAVNTGSVRTESGDVSRRKWLRIVRSVSLSKPLFMYKTEDSIQARQVRYLLLGNRTKKERIWILYYVHPQTGNVSEIAFWEGLFGYNDMVAKLKKQGIDERDILWSDCPEE